MIVCSSKIFGIRAELSEREKKTHPEYKLSFALLKSHSEVLIYVYSLYTACKKCMWVCVLYNPVCMLS